VDKYLIIPLIQIHRLYLFLQETLISFQKLNYLIYQLACIEELLTYKEKIFFGLDLFTKKYLIEFLKVKDLRKDWVLYNLLKM
jgi:hypothetical protein